MSISITSVVQQHRDLIKVAKEQHNLSKDITIAIVSKYVDCYNSWSGQTHTTSKQKGDKVGCEVTIGGFFNIVTEHSIVNEEEIENITFKRIDRDLPWSDTNCVPKHAVNDALYNFLD